MGAVKRILGEYYNERTECRAALLTATVLEVGYLTMRLCKIDEVLSLAESVWQEVGANNVQHSRI